MKSLAYLCEYEKGGALTTAIALQQTPQGVVYWFASNQECTKEDRVKTFLGEVLCMLATTTKENAAQLRADLFVKAVEFSVRKICTYIRFLKPELDFVLGYLDEDQEVEGR